MSYVCLQHTCLADYFIGNQQGAVIRVGNARVVGTQPRGIYNVQETGISFEEAQWQHQTENVSDHLCWRYVGLPHDSNDDDDDDCHYCHHHL